MTSWRSAPRISCFCIWSRKPICLWGGPGPFCSPLSCPSVCGTGTIIPHRSSYYGFPLYCSSLFWAKSSTVSK
jgi:hypothetical protein